MKSLFLYYIYHSNIIVLYYIKIILFYIHIYIAIHREIYDRGTTEQDH